MNDEPFAVLGIAPTCDPAAIKRAYFAALARTPPHADREGFRKLRAAYEQLSDARARTLAFLRAPIDQSAELAAFDARWGARIAEESAKAKAAENRTRAVERFVRRVTGMSWDDVMRDAAR